MLSTASETRDRAADAADARKFPFAIRATINVARCANFGRERQIVAAHFVGDVEIAAGVAPFRAVRSDSASSFFAKLREQMSELVSKRAIDLFIAVIVKQRVQ